MTIRKKIPPMWWNRKKLVHPFTTGVAAPRQCPPGKRRKLTRDRKRLEELKRVRLLGVKGGKEAQKKALAPIVQAEADCVAHSKRK